MKKSILIVLSLCMMLSLSACRQNDTVPTTTSQPGTVATSEPTVPSTTELPTADFEAELSSVSLPVITEEKYDGETLVGYYSYQNISVTTPDADVAEGITLDMLNRIDATAEPAKALLEAAATAYNSQSNWYPYFYRINFNVTRLDQNILSFYGTETSFDGSPHNVSASVSATYDLTTGSPLSLANIFYEDYSADALCELIIEGLSEYTNGELFSDYKEIIRQKFSTNTPIESWYFTGSGICFYFAPYEISSFAHGTVLSEIPYDKLSGLLNDAYFPTEQLVYTGQVDCTQLSANDYSILDQYTQFGEVVLKEGSDRLLVTVDGSVANLRILLDSEDPNTSGSMVFATYGLGSTDAVIIEAPSDTWERITILYESNGESVTITP